MRNTDINIDTTTKCKRSVSPFYYKTRFCCLNTTNRLEADERWQRSVERDADSKPDGDYDCAVGGGARRHFRRRDLVDGVNHRGVDETSGAVFERRRAPESDCRRFGGCEEERD